MQFQDSQFPLDETDMPSAPATASPQDIRSKNWLKRQFIRLSIRQKNQLWLCPFYRDCSFGICDGTSDRKLL
jgi:hypothetical protein